MASPRHRPGGAGLAGGRRAPQDRGDGPPRAGPPARARRGAGRGPPPPGDARRLRAGALVRRHVPVVGRVAAESFAGHWGSEPRSEEDWARSTVGTRHFRADWSFVVLDGDRVAAYTLASAYRQDWEAQGYTCGWTDLLGARPAWRGRRLAPALLAASMRAMAASGMQRADIGVDSENASGALQLYTSLGYEPQRRSVAYAKEIAPQVSPPMSTA